MAPDEARKRKACVNCTHAKAKCSPSISKPDACERCFRLGKGCIYLDVSRRRAQQRTRSRVQQLEQKVDSLITMLAISEQQNAASSSTTSSTTSPEVAPSHSTGNSSMSPSHVYPTENCEDGEGIHTDYQDDIIDRGLLTSLKAEGLLNLYREKYMQYFPFVVIPDTWTIDYMRREQPFLFLCIMSVVMYKDIVLQRLLGEEIKSQIASRIISRPEKTLDLLQGLLVHTCWYQQFFRLSNPQLAVMIQLCIALVHDLGLSKNPKNKNRKLLVPGSERECLPITDNIPDRNAAEKRVLLGTFYVAAIYAQTWRRATTMTYTKLMEQWAQNLSHTSEVQSDGLIYPLVKLQELMYRVNNFFSYDDIDNAELRGESIIFMVACNFRIELDSIRARVPADLSQNVVLTLQFLTLDIWIHEASIHNELWALSPQNMFPAHRVQMLWRTAQATTAYFKEMLSLSPELFHQLCISVWCGWFYALIICCKTVFLQEDMKKELIDTQSTSNGSRISEQLPTGALQQDRSSISETNANSWNPVLIEKGVHAIPLFENLLEKVSQAKQITPVKDGKASFLYNLSVLQNSLLVTYKRRLQEYSTSSATEPISNEGASSIPVSQLPLPTFTEWFMPENINQWQGSTPMAGGIQALDPNLPSSATMPAHYDDMVWDMMMEDFAMPAM